MIVTILELIAKSNIAKSLSNIFRNQVTIKLNICYMTEEEVMKYIISTHDDKPISTDSI